MANQIDAQASDGLADPTRRLEGPAIGRGQVATVGAFPAVDRARWLRERIVRILERGEQRMGWAGDVLSGHERVQDGWKQPPGSCAFWALRQKLGGRVGAEEFAEAVEALLADGRAIEVWLELPDRRDPPHCLVLPGRSEGLRFPVARARGLPAILQAEPWYTALEAS